MSGKSASSRELDARLIAAVQRCELAEVRRLLGAGANPNARDSKGNPVLWHTTTAASAGFSLGDRDVAIIEALLEAGADPKRSDVALRLCKAVWSQVSSAAEAGDARRLASVLGVPKRAYER